MKILFRILGLLLLLFLLYVGGVLLHGTLTDWQPEDVIPLDAGGETGLPTRAKDSTYSFLIWNLGYGGLGAESDFFYDKGGMWRSGGRMIRPPYELVRKNVDGILQQVSATPVDFVLLQEVDYNSKRSYGINQYQAIDSLLEPYAAAFAPNYRAPRVPIPILEPWQAYGRVHSGLATFSVLQPDSLIRYQLPGSFGWPTRIFQLDRCALVSRFPVDADRDLVVVNVHNSAYDKTGELKREQMAFLREFLEDNYAQGHFVVVGGDWNQCPPFFPFDTFRPGKSQGYSQININPELLPADWTWVYDPVTPTNRKVGEVYDPENTFLTLIDFYLISPNIRAQKVRTIDLNFAYSDHQPVYLEVELLKDRR